MLRHAFKDERRTEVIVSVSLISVQLINAVYTVFIAGRLASGLEPLFLIAAGGFANAFLLLPIAIALERKKWAGRIEFHLMVRLSLIGFGGVPLFQMLMLTGIKMTTPAVATAMPNLAPGLIFIVASCFRIERFDIKCSYTRFKIVGTLTCLSGAMATGLLQGSAYSVHPRVSSSLRSAIMAETLGINTDNYADWMIGCLCLLVGVVAFSCIMVLQAKTMVDYFPTPITLGVITNTLGSSFTVMFQLILQGNINTGAASVGITNVISTVSVAGLVSCISTLILVLCIHKKGPVYISVFHPIQTVCATILSAIFLKQFISLGSFVGMALMFAGLYIVLWAKSKEAGDEVENAHLCPDEEKPLLL